MAADGQLFAIIGQRKLRSIVDVVGAEKHNLRRKLLPNVDLNGPAPVLLQGGPDVWAELNDRLEKLSVRRRKGAVLGIEVMLTASPEWWSSDRARRAEQVQAVQDRAFEYLADRFAIAAIVSVIRHDDETSPHWHAVVAAVEHKVDGRRRSRKPIWQLNAAGLVGHRGDMAREHDRWAGLLAPLGLRRGKERSGAKNKPNVVYRAEMEQAIREARITRDAADAELDAAIRERGDLSSRLAAAAALQADLAARERATAEREDAVRRMEAEAVARSEAARRDAEAVQLRLTDLEAREAALEARAAAASAWQAKANRQARELKARAAAVGKAEAATKREAIAVAAVLAELDIARDAVRAAVGYDDIRYTPRERVMADVAARINRRLDRAPVMAAAVAARRSSLRANGL